MSRTLQSRIQVIRERKFCGHLASFFRTVLEMSADSLFSSHNAAMYGSRSRAVKTDRRVGAGGVTWRLTTLQGRQIIRVIDYRLFSQRAMREATTLRRQEVFMLTAWRLS